MQDLELKSFSSRQYEFSSLNVLVGGKPIIGLLGLSYKVSQDKKAIYGKGNLPIAIQKGNISTEGTLKVLQSELETLVKAGGKNGLLGLEVDIVAEYGNPSQGDMPKIDILRGVQFTEEPRELNQGDTNMEIELPFIFLRIDRKM